MAIQTLGRGLTDADIACGFSWRRQQYPNYKNPNTCPGAAHGLLLVGHNGCKGLFRDSPDGGRHPGRKPDGEFSQQVVGTALACGLNSANNGPIAYRVGKENRTLIAAFSKGSTEGAYRVLGHLPVDAHGISDLLQISYLFPVISG